MTESSHLRIYRYGVRMRVFERTQYLETLFPDGSSVPAAPQRTPEYAETAQRLGYGAEADAQWRMCKEHEEAHTTLLQSLGLRYSPTLWAVAHGHHAAIPGSPGEMAAEEDLVLAYQRWARLRALHSGRHE